MSTGRSPLPLWVSIPMSLLVLGACWIFMTPTLSTPRSHVWRNQTLNNLRGVGIAVHTYATKFDGWIPPGGSPADRLPQWSWETQLLPYLDQEALFRSIDFTRPWNAPENAKMFATNLRFLQSPAESDRQSADGFAVTHFTANSRVFGARTGVRLDDVSKGDGLSMTLMMGEIGSAFPPWGQPGNTRDPARGLGGGPDQFGNARRDVCAVVFLGGNSRFLSPDTSPQVLLLIADSDNGIPDDDF